YLTWKDAAPDLVRWALAWLDDTEERAARTRALEALKRRVAHPGATDRAAERIVARLSRTIASRPVSPAVASPTPYRGPHEPGPRQPARHEHRA
ncbi:MAG: hypothetical protein ACYC61_13060, partial [Isosphaeraceae bacterium]